MSTAPDYTYWPDVLRELAEIVGPKTAMRLANAYGGVECLYIPKEQVAAHPWEQVLTPLQWAKVVKRWGGQSVSATRVLRELVEVVGPETAAQLANAYGGVYIPKKRVAHPWEKVLTPLQWAKVVKQWGGQRVSLPRGTHVKPAKREIFDLNDQGVSHRQIALRVGVTQRHVRRVLQGASESNHGR